MAGNRLLQQRLLLNTFRCFHRNTIFRDSKSPGIPSTTSKIVEKKGEGEQANFPELKGVDQSPLGPVMYTPKTFDKWLLVWFKQYKSIDEVPNQIRQEKMAKIHSKTRIRVANFLMLFSLALCTLTVFSGKKEAASGESIQQRILDRNQQLRREYLAGTEKEKST